MKDALAPEKPEVAAQPARGNEHRDTGMPAPPDGENRFPGASRLRAVVSAGLMLGMLIAAMESTVVSTAMPTVIGDLRGIALYPWVFSAYLLTSTTTVPIYGKLADLFGRRRVFLAAIGIFLVGSMLSGAAHSMPQLIAFRALQGLGAGGVLPLTLTIIGDLYALQERARVQGLFTSMWGTASLAGPVIGAKLTLDLSWRWVFYINLPFGLLSALLVGACLREGAESRSTERIDYPGLVLLTAGVTALLALLLRMGHGTLRPDMTTLALGALTLLLGVAFVRQECRVNNPMLPPLLFRHPVLGACMLGNILIGVLLYGIDTYMPLFMQGARGGDAHSASQVLTPLVLFWSISAYFGARALVRFGFRKTAAFGVGCISAAMIGLAFVSPQTPSSLIIGLMALVGLGLGPCSMTFLVTAQNVVAWQQRGMVTAASQFFRTISGTIGVGLLGALLNARMGALSSGPESEQNPNALLNAAARASLSPSALEASRRALAVALHPVFLVMALFALAAAGAILHTLLASRERV